MFFHFSVMHAFSFPVTLLLVFSAVIAGNAQVRPAAAPPTLSITGKAAGKKAVYIGNLRADGSPQSQLFLQTLQKDLNRTGWLVVSTNPGTSARVDGTVGGGEVRATVFSDNGTASPLVRQGADPRTLAHAASDEILLKLTGHKGMASAPIIFAGKAADGRTYIYSCDANGENIQRITSDGSICLSPTWMPGANGFLYTSFKEKHSSIYRYDKVSGTRWRPSLVAGYPGLNNGGVVSPDGSYAAMVLSCTGNVELYVKSMSSGKLRRLTKTPYANESSPDWSPDGRSIAYASDEAHFGAPQVYVLRQGAAKGERVIFGFSESSSPDWSPDGTKIAFCGKKGGSGYQIFVHTMGGGDEQITSDGATYEDPCWAPDGRHIVATRKDGRRRSLYLLDALDAKGNPPVKLTAAEGEAYLADWAK